MKSTHWTYGLALAGITLLAAALRWYQIDGKTIWLDEAYSIWIANHSLADMLRLVTGLDQHPPLFYGLLHAWMRLGGTGAGWVRSLSALAGVLTIPAIFLLARRLAGDTAGLLAAIILAIAPLHIAYGQETRMYALEALFTTLSLWTTVRLLTDPRSGSDRIGVQLLRWFRRTHPPHPPADPVDSAENISSTLPAGPPWSAISTDLTWIGYMLFMALTWHVESTSLFLPVAVNLFVFLLMIFARFRPGDARQLRPPSFANWCLSQLGLLLLISPWLPSFFHQLAGVQQEFWTPTPTLDTLIDVFKSLLSDHLPDAVLFSSLAWVSFALLLLLGTFYFRERPAHLLFALMLILVPLVGMIALSKLSQPVFFLRPVIWVSIPLYVLLAAGLAQLRAKPLLLAGLAALALTNASSLQVYYNDVQKEDWRSAAQWVAQNAQDEDLLLFNAAWTQIPFDYYYAGYNRPLAEAGAPATMFESGELEPRMTANDVPRILQLTQNRDRVWLVYSHNWWTDPQGLIVHALDGRFRVLDFRQLHDIEVVLYGIR